MVGTERVESDLLILLDLVTYLEAVIEKLFQLIIIFVFPNIIAAP